MHGRIQEMSNLFEEARVKAIIKTSIPQSEEGSSGLRYNYLQTVPNACHFQPYSAVDVLDTALKFQYFCDGAKCKAICVE